MIKWSNVRWIYLREIRDQLRDRRTLFTIFVLPVLLYPLLGMGFLQTAQFSREHRSTILLLGADALPRDPPLITAFSETQTGEVQFATAICPEEEQKLFRITVAPVGATWEPDALRVFAEQQIHDGRYEAVIYFPNDFATRLAAFHATLKSSPSAAREDGENRGAVVVPEPLVFINSANDKSRIARDRVDRVLQRWRQSIVTENLREQNIPQAATEPFQVTRTDVAPESSRRAALWSKVLPFIVLIWALTGAFYPAVDLCAGEKERGTLETLLCSPAQRLEIVWGKLLTIMTFSVATSLLNLASLGTTGTFLIMQMERQGASLGRSGIGTPPLSAVLWLLMALIPLSALFSALSLAVAAIARSSREGQYYLMPLLFITLPLMMLSLMPTAELDLGTSLIPVTGVMLLLRSLIEGHYIESLRFVGPVIFVTGLCCWLAIRWAVRQFNDESVLFRESERWGLGVWVRHLRRDRGDTPSLTEALFCGVLLLLLMRFFAPLVFTAPQNWNAFATVTTVTLMAFVATPALIMAVVLTRKPGETLRLRAPRFVGLGQAVLLALTIHPAGVAVGQLVSRLYPISPAIEGHLKTVEVMFQQAPNIGIVLLVLALAPAICEELAFRGFILSGMQQLGSNWAAILASAAFFGATHAFVQQSLTACLLGIVIGYVAIQTRSLLPGLAFHFLYNSLSLLMGTLVADALPGSRVLSWLFAGSGESMMYRWPLVAISFLASGVILWSMRTPPSEGERPRGTSGK